MRCYCNSPFLGFLVNWFSLRKVCMAFVQVLLALSCSNLFSGGGGGVTGQVTDTWSLLSILPVLLCPEPFHLSTLLPALAARGFSRPSPPYPAARVTLSHSKLWRVLFQLRTFPRLPSTGASSPNSVTLTPSLIWTQKGRREGREGVGGREGKERVASRLSPKLPN